MFFHIILITYKSPSIIRVYNTCLISLYVKTNPWFCREGTKNLERTKKVIVSLEPKFRYCSHYLKNYSMVHTNCKNGQLFGKIFLLSAQCRAQRYVFCSISFVLNFCILQWGFLTVIAFRCSYLNDYSTLFLLDYLKPDVSRLPRIFRLLCIELHL